MAITIDEVLDQLSFASAELVNGNANHGPMAAEALFALGRDDAVLSWVDGYRGPVDAPPASILGHSTRRLAGMPWSKGAPRRLDRAVRE